MKLIKELLENSSSGDGLGYYIIDDFENAAVDGPYDDKSEAESNRKQYYKGDDRTTFSIAYGTVSKNGHFAAATKDQKVSEDAAAGSISAGSIAGTRGVMFGGPAVKRKIPKSERVQKIKFSNRANWNIRESFLASLVEFADIGGKFNSADTISKLTGAEKQDDFDRNSVPFGIEDEKGNVVKVYVRPEQADDFEKVLGSVAADTAMNNKEIAEILFNLKNQFDIVHVEWPALPEDEEQEATTPDDNAELEMSDDSGNGADLGAPVGDEPVADGGDDSSVKSALDKVIDMLKADAEARKAEADAKGQEAKAKEAEYAAKMAEQKVKSEEEVLDMETFYKNKGEERKEAQKLIKLAKYRHDLASSAGEELDQ